MGCLLRLINAYTGATLGAVLGANFLVNAWVSAFYFHDQWAMRVVKVGVAFVALSTFLGAAAFHFLGCWLRHRFGMTNKNKPLHDAPPIAEPFEK